MTPALRLGAMPSSKRFVFERENDMSNLVERFQSISTVLNFLPVDQVFVYLFPVCLAVGIGIGFIGSFFTVRKHLRV